MTEIGKSAVEKLAAAHAPTLVKQLGAAAPSRADAEDAVQDAMLALLDAPHVLAMVENVGSWLYTMVRRRCIDIIRRDSVRRSYEQRASLQEIFAGSPDPFQLMESRELVTAVAQATERLDAPLRLAFVDNALEGKTFKEISQQTGIPMGTLMARKQRAIAQITKELRRRGFLPQSSASKETRQ